MITRYNDSGFNTFFTPVVRSQDKKSYVLPEPIETDETELKRNNTIWKEEWDVNAPNLVKFLFEFHKAYGLEPHFSFKSYLRAAKKLIDEFSPQKTKDLLLKFEEDFTPNYPFSFKFVRKWFLEHNEDK